MSCAVALALGTLFAIKLRFYGMRAAAIYHVAFCIFAFACAAFTLGKFRAKTLKAQDGLLVGARQIAHTRGDRLIIRVARLAAVSAFFLIGFNNFSVCAARYQKTRDFAEPTFVTAQIEQSRKYNANAYYLLSNLSFNGVKTEGKLTLSLHLKIGEETENEGTMVAFTAKIKQNVAWLSNVAESAGNAGEAQKGRERVYEWRRDIRYEAETCKDFRVIGNTTNIFIRIRQKLNDALKTSASQESYSLGKAVLTGETAEIGGALLENFRYGGIAHIFAVSGLHVGAFFAFLLKLFARKKFKGTPAPFRWVTVAAILLFYGAVCGFSASVVRATVMCLIYYADVLLGCKRDSAESMGKAALLLLLISPVSILDVGFLLSFSAVGGIIFLSPTISRLLSGWIPKRAAQNSVGNALVSVFSMSLSATALTTPVTCAYFGYVSGISLLFNVLIVPLISAVFPLMLLLAVLATIFSLAAPLISFSAAILYLPSLALSLLALLFHAADLSPFAITFPFSALSLAGYYIACAAASDKFNLCVRKRRIAIIFGVIAFLIGMVL